jgi:RimJ/RimL family protein N-acetyltransferase
MPENIASRRVAEKAGMRFDGHVTAYEIEGLLQYAAARAWWMAPGQGES